MVVVIGNDRLMMSMRHEREMVMKDSGVTESVVVLRELGGVANDKKIRALGATRAIKLAQPSQPDPIGREPR